MFERKYEEALKLKGISIAFCDTKHFDTWETYQLYLKLQTTLSFYSSRIGSLEFCMTLTLSGVSKMKVTSEGHTYDPPLTRVSQIASMAEKLANNLEMHLVPIRFKSLGTKWIAACFSTFFKEVKWPWYEWSRKTCSRVGICYWRDQLVDFFMKCVHHDSRPMCNSPSSPQIAFIIKIGFYRSFIWLYIEYIKQVKFWQSFNGRSYEW